MSQVSLETRHPCPLGGFGSEALPSPSSTSAARRALPVRCRVCRGRPRSHLSHGVECWDWSSLVMLRRHSALPPSVLLSGTGVSTGREASRQPEGLLQQAPLALDEHLSMHPALRGRQPRAGDEPAILRSVVSRPSRRCLRTGIVLAARVCEHTTMTPTRGRVDPSTVCAPSSSALARRLAKVPNCGRVGVDESRKASRLLLARLPAPLELRRALARV